MKQYDMFFTVLATGKTYKVYNRVTEKEVLDIIRLQQLSFRGIELNAVVRGEFRSGNADLNGQIGFWDISVSQS